MTKKKIRTTSKSGNVKDTSASNLKTLSMPTGLNSMMNWLAGLLLIVSFIYSILAIDVAMAPRDALLWS